MTRKHFEAIAADIRNSTSFKSQAARERFARDIASTLRATNGRFDTERFVFAATR
jgi:hypothetical protein